MTGATGWLGRATLEVLSHWLDPEVFSEHVDARSSVPREVVLSNAKIVRTSPITEPSKWDHYTLVNLAFLTRDHVEASGVSQYMRSNLRLLLRGLELLERADGAVLVSSGAATSQPEQLDWDAKANPYGFLKNVEEQSMRACADADIPITVCRLWGAAGPDVVHPRKYAFSDFVVQALMDSRIEVQAPHAVWRRYCDARQLMDLCLRLNLEGCDITFDSGGPLVEIRDLARIIASAVGPDVGVEYVSAMGTADTRYAELSDMESLMADRGLTPSTIPELAAATVEGLRGRVESADI